MVALSMMGSAILLFSCGSADAESDGANNETLMTERSEHLTILMSENGRRSYHFTTPLLEGYTLASDPYREFRKGIRITTYQNDSLTTVNATLVANYAIFYEERELWEAKGDVVVIQTNGRRLYTQQLFWNQSTHRIYSNVDSRIVDGDEMTDCEGFESDEEMTQWKYRKLKGVTYFTMSEDGGTKSDSTKVDKTSPKNEPAKSTARPAAKPKTANKPKAGQRPKTPMVTPASPRFDAPRSGAQRKVEPIQSSRLEGQNIEDASSK